MTLVEALNEWWGYPPDFDEGLPFVIGLKNKNRLMLWKNMTMEDNLTSVRFGASDIVGNVLVDSFGIGIRNPQNGPVTWLYEGPLYSAITVVGGNDLTLNFDLGSVDAIRLMVKGYYSSP